MHWLKYAQLSNNHWATIIVCGTKRTRWSLECVVWFSPRIYTESHCLAPLGLCTQSMQWTRETHPQVNYPWLCLLNLLWTALIGTHTKYLDLIKAYAYLINSYVHYTSELKQISWEVLCTWVYVILCSLCWEVSLQFCIFICLIITSYLLSPSGCWSAPKLMIEGGYSLVGVLLLSGSRRSWSPQWLSGTSAWFWIPVSLSLSCKYNRYLLYNTAWASTQYICTLWYT